MSSRKPLIVANWKMNLGISQEAAGFISEFCNRSLPFDFVDAVICPPFTVLESVRKLLADSSTAWGAQNCYFEDNGAYTGEISADFLKALGCKYVIIGHSERRQYFGDTDEIVSRKLVKVLAKGMTPIFCLGESDAQREANLTFDVIGAQLSQGLKGFDQNQMAGLVIAYEPIWAIGTGKTATPDQAQEVHKYIREWLQKNHNQTISSQLRILYGGSVKPANTKSLMAQPDIDGALVGGASLVAKDFAEIILNSISE